MKNNNFPDSRSPQSEIPGSVLITEEPPRKSGGPPKIKNGPGCFSRAFGCFGLLLFVVLLIAFLVGLKYSVYFLAPEEISREVVVSIPERATATQIGGLLEQAGVIKSGRAFVWALKVKNKLAALRAKDGSGQKPLVLKAGEMALDPSLPVWKTIDLIAKGNYKLYPFTVPEGRNIYEIAKMVEEAGLGSSEEFLALCRDSGFISTLGLDVDNLEGYLFPNTYSFPKGTPVKAIIKPMADTFIKVWRKYEAAARSMGLTHKEVLILASIVEKETGVARERPIIAGVFYNRLAKGMKLQTDPTVAYGFLPDNFDGNITKKHLQTAHPYNTYVIPGLPPGPIANPGEAAINAVVNPSVVPYYYFVAKNDGSGSHDFSETLAEHNRKVERYLKKNNNAKKKSRR